MTRIKVGIVGCGKQAPKHISGLRAFKDAEVELVVADVDISAAQKLGKQFDVQVADSVDSIFAMPDVDAIDICTPVFTHHELCVKTLNSDKHLFCEKPLVTNIQEAEELEHLRKSKDLVGMVGYIYRFVPVLGLYKELSGKTGFAAAFGQEVTANFRIGGRGSHQLWKHQSAKGGGAINEMLVHMVDLALWYFGQPEKIEVFSCEQLLSQRNIAGKIHDVDAEDSIIVQMRMLSNVVVNIQADMLTPSFTQFVEIQGQQGTFCGSIQSDYNSYLFLGDKLETFDQGMNKLNIESMNLFEAQMGQFLNAVLDPVNSQVSSSINDSINLLTVMDQIKQLSS